MSINSSTFGDVSVSMLNVSNTPAMNRPSSVTSSSSSSTTPHAVLPQSSSSLPTMLEETTFVTKTFTFKWNLIGYPFASAPMRSENFSPPDSPGDIWFLHLDPPKLRVEKGVSVGSGMSNITSVYSTSSLDLKDLAPTHSVRFSDGFEYYTDVKLSLILKRRGSDNTSSNSSRKGDSSNHPVTAGFEITLASNDVSSGSGALSSASSTTTSSSCSSSISEGSRVVHFSWVAFNESFAPFSEYPSKTFSFKGKITELVNTHRLTSLTITCQLFYNPNILNSHTTHHHNSHHQTASSSSKSNGIMTRKGIFADDHFYFGCCDSNLQQQQEEKYSLIHDLKTFFSDKKQRKLTSDMVITGTDGAVSVHRVILISRSSVFREMFEKDSDLAASGQINIFGVSVKILKPLVEFLYTDTISPDDLKGIDYELFLLSDKYKIPKLKSLTEVSIAKGITELNCGEVMALCRNIKSSVIQRKLHEFFSQ